MPSKVTSKNKEGKNYIIYILVGLLVIAAFAIGSLYQRVQLFEQGIGVKNQEQAVPPAEEPVVAEVKVTDDDPSLGPKNAKVTVVMFEDFQCPFCGAFAGLNEEIVASMMSRDPSWQPALPNIKKEYVDTGKVRLVWKDYPFLGQESIWAGAAARCAQDQNKFWEYHDYLFSHQSGENQGAFSKDKLKSFAAELKFNTKDFDDCLDSGKHEKKLQEAITYGQSVGVNGTPATYINGKLISGAAPFSDFKAQIDPLL